MKRTPRSFSPQGANYSGNIKRGRGFSSEYAGYSGNMRRSPRGFSPQGEGYSGNIKRGRGFNTDYVGYSGNLPQRASRKYFEVWSYDYLGNQKRVKGSARARVDGIGKTKYRYPEGFTSEGIGYSGRQRSKRPAKGGGTVSGILWNNQESPLGNVPPANMAGSTFSGRTKARRPEKGGGSVSGILWNNQESPLGKVPPANMAGSTFSGRTKAKRPDKGGGSVSGILWNNKESPLGKVPPANMAGPAFSGTTKAKRPDKGGGTVSGVLWNNNERALAKSPPATLGATEGLQVKVKQADYSRKKNAHKDALPGIAPTQGSVKASEYSRSMKMYWNYKHNPNASRYALKTIGPGKAEARMRDYHGNTRMRKSTVSGLHPDAKFAHSEEDNVKSEKGLLTNVKLFWQKMFNKSGTQPSNVKEKGKKLEYDKREKGLWAY